MVGNMPLFVFICHMNVVIIKQLYWNGHNLFVQEASSRLFVTPVSTDHYGPLLCVTSDVIRTIVVWHRLNQIPT